jgi:GTPase SAR1 family protein
VIKVLINDKLGVGKTSIVEAYINNRYSPTAEATLGACFYKKDIT